MSDILNKLKRSIVDPAVSSIRTSSLAYVLEVNDSDKTANVITLEKDGNRRRLNSLSFDTGRGLESNYLKIGDTVEVGYRNNSQRHAYIIRVHESSPTNSDTIVGQDLPIYTNLF